MGQVAVVHGEAIVMLSHRHDEPGAGVLEELRPFRRIEILRLEHGNEVFVAEFGMVAPGLAVMFECGVVLQVHAPRIPLIAECGYAVRSPVDEDAEFGIHVPFGDFVLAQ